MDVLLAGRAGVALTWVWWLLGTNPLAEQRLHAELEETLRGERPSAADVDWLVYARAVLFEALRLYPPGWGLLRRATRPFDLDGVRIPAGRWLFVSFWALHRDELFSRDASTFSPERWLGDRAREIPPFVYLPFAVGRRRCPARSFAILLCMLTIAALAQRWRLRPVRSTVELTFVPFLRPRGGMPIRLELRNGGGA